MRSPHRKNNVFTEKNGQLFTVFGDLTIKTDSGHWQHMHFLGCFFLATKLPSGNWNSERSRKDEEPLWWIHQARGRWGKRNYHGNWENLLKSLLLYENPGQGNQNEGTRTGQTIQLMCAEKCLGFGLESFLKVKISLFCKRYSSKSYIYMILK